MLPALSLDGILHLEVVENAITGADFHRFVEGLLPRMNEFPLPNSVLVKGFTPLCPTWAVVTW